MLVNPSLASMIESSPWMLMPIIIIVTLCLAVLLIAIVGKRQFSQYGFKLPEGSNVRKALSIGFVAGIVLSVFARLSNVEVTFMGQPPLLYIILLSWIETPIQEEVIFRGLFQSYLAMHIKSSITIWKWKATTPALIGAIAFSLVHLTLLTVESTLGGVLLIILGAFVLGIIAGHLRAETSSLISPIIVHAIFNLIGTVFELPA
jgi:membrane protease YdiL (CAAX protease family)